MKSLILYFIFFLPFASFAIGPITGTTAVCVGTTTTLTDATTPGGTWASSNTTVATITSAGIVNGIAAGTATITYTSGTFATTTVTVNMPPTLSSALTVPPKCDSILFNYFPTSTVPGTTFMWSRAYVVGLANLAATGVAGISEILKNTTNVPVAVVYTYNLSAGGCTTTATVSVTINPRPTLSSTATAGTICSNDTFSYVPSSYVSGATFDWRREAVSGILPIAGFGTANVSEKLTNTTLAALAVTYKFRVTANGCTNLQEYLVSAMVDTCDHTLAVPVVNTAGNLFPNPNNGRFTFQYPTTVDEDILITVTNMAGQMLCELAARSNAPIQMDIQAPNGIYLLTIAGNRSRHFGKIVVNK